MEHIAIDLGGKHSQVCIRDAAENIVQEGKQATVGLGEFLKGRPRSRVIVETCAEAFGVADAALQHGHEVRVVPATLVRTLGVGSRGTKTDKRDARILSEVSCRIDLPSVHVPQALSRERKAMCGMREALVSARTQLVNTVRGWLRASAERPRNGATHTLPQRVRAWASEKETTLPAYVERQLKAIEEVSKLIEEADQELEKHAEKDSVCKRLMTVPGVGPVTAVRFAAALDVTERFEGPHKVEAYLGLTPGESSSSMRTHRTGITKAGPAAVRRTLIQAAWAARRAKGTHPMLLWALEVERRRGKAIAAVALARKMVGIMFAIWRDGTVYEPQRAAQMPDMTERKKALVARMPAAS